MELHRKHQFDLEDIEDFFDACLSESRHAPDIGSADQDGVRAHGESLEDIGSAPEPAVYQHRHATLRGVHDLPEAFDGAAAARVCAASVVRHDDAVRTALDRPPRIVTAHDAFHEDVHVGGVLQATDEFPGQARRIEVHATHVQAVEHRFAGQPPDREIHGIVVGGCCIVAGGTITGVEPSEALQGFAIAPDRQVHREHQRGASRPFGATDQGLGHVPVRRGVELVPHRPGPGRVHVFHRGRRHGGENLVMPHAL